MSEIQEIEQEVAWLTTAVAYVDRMTECDRLYYPELWQQLRDRIDARLAIEPHARMAEHRRDG